MHRTELDGLALRQFCLERVAKFKAPTRIVGWKDAQPVDFKTHHLVRAYLASLKSTHFVIF